MIILKITIILSFVLWAILEGYEEAELFHYKSIAPQPKVVPHFLFTSNRLIVGALIAWITKDWMFCLGLAMTFSLIHNGIYYHTRHKLNPFIYPLGWRDSSTTSTAKLNFGFFARMTMAQIGLVLIIVSMVLSAQSQAPLQ